MERTHSTVTHEESRKHTVMKAERPKFCVHVYVWERFQTVQNGSAGKCEQNLSMTRILSTDLFEA